MASGPKMAYTYYQQGSKYNTLPQIPQKDVEVTQDMHLKMSKKIAQLTKVIYALNTKNDENEAIVQKLRDEHEEELQKILAETHQKVAIYKERLNEESDYAATVSALQSRLAEYQLQVSEANSQLQNLKRQADDTQKREQAAYEAKLVDMSTELLRVKTDFTECMKNFELWRERILNEHNIEVADVHSKHQKELEDLRGFQRNQDDSWLNQCAKIEDKYRSELESLKTQIEAFQSERKTMKDDYEAKLDKASAFYEKELEALRKNHSEQHNKEFETLQKEMTKLRASCSTNENEMRAQIDGLVIKLTDAETALDESKVQQQVLHAELSGRDSHAKELIKQIENLSEEISKKTAHIQSIDAALSDSKQQCSHLQDQLTQNSSTLHELESHNQQKQDQITALQETLQTLKIQLSQAKAEQLALQSQHLNLSSEQSGQLRSLQQAIEDLTVERETLKQLLEQRVSSFQALLAQKDADMEACLAKQAKEAEQKLQETRDADRQMAANTLTSVKQELKLAYDAELSRAVFERNALQQEMETLKAQLTAQLISAKDEVTRLNKIVEDNKEGLGTASSQVSSLKEAMNRLTAELDKTRNELQTYKTKAALLEVRDIMINVVHGI
ncbi:protein fam184a-like [Plakobranchus ocellatus]|uniref:Protein fam184a-like n=1 Tax=Plakobranchus ocellatus TaxID=259542 RepID=A0AAV4D9T3_9GAST|nr:protein fam184a-like [Plakobranchus ocellatus]